MLADVVEAAGRARLDGVLAVVDRPAAQAVVEQTGAIALLDRGVGMNAAAQLGISAAVGRGATTIIVLPGDVPLIEPDDLWQMVAAADQAVRAVVIGADRDRLGTNALLLRPPAIIAPSFGPPSLDRHVSLGLAAGAYVRVVTEMGLSHDVDTPADLATLQSDRLGRHTATAMTLLSPRFSSHRDAYGQPGGSFDLQR
jgi:2-phospho-L-lactate guanylyltransferase